MRNHFLVNVSNRLLIVYLILWTTLNGLTLTVFPAVHSDEAWLAGLAQAYLDRGSVAVTEPFFDLFPRQPHAFKMLFHVLQAGLIWLLGFDVFAVRLLSLSAAVVTLILVYLAIARQSGRRGLALGLMIALSVQPLFVTTAHVARQESLILAVLAASFAVLPLIRQPRHGLWLGVLLGGAALIHPNALFPAVIAGLILFWNTALRRLSPKIVWVYGLGLALSGSALVALSLWVSPDFLQNYAEFGANLAVDAAPNQRGANLLQFLRQLWRQDNGTYWLPDMRVLMVGTLVLPALGLMVLWLAGSAKAGQGHRALDSVQPGKMQLEYGLLGLVGFVGVLFVIGRFNPTSTVFVLVPLVWMVGGIVEAISNGIAEGRWGKKFHRPYRLLLARLRPYRLRLARSVPLLIVAGAIWAGGVALPRDFGPFVSQRIGGGGDPYQVYNAEIQHHLPENPVVLGNLSAGFVLQRMTECFYDLRNLTYVTSNIGSIEHRFQSEKFEPDNSPDVTQSPSPSATPLPLDADAPASDQTVKEAVAAYLEERGINTVIWYEEYDFILRHPDWWVLYEIRPDRTADPAVLHALKAILEQEGKLIHTFTAPIYGTRVVRYQGDYPWAVSLYQLDRAANGETPPIQ